MPEVIKIGTNLNWDRVYFRQLRAEQVEDAKTGYKIIPEVEFFTQSPRLMVTCTRGVRAARHWVSAGYVSAAVNMQIDSVSPKARDPVVMNSQRLLLDRSQLLLLPITEELYNYKLVFNFHRWLQSIVLEIF